MKAFPCSNHIQEAHTSNTSLTLCISSDQTGEAHHRNKRASESQPNMGDKVTMNLCEGESTTFLIGLSATGNCNGNDEYYYANDKYFCTVFPCSTWEQVFLSTDLNYWTNPHNKRRQRWSMARGITTFPCTDNCNPVYITIQNPQVQKNSEGVITPVEMYRYTYTSL